MTAQRLQFIITILARARKQGAKLIGKTPFEKELNDWINAPPIQCESITWEPGPIDYPPLYE